MLIIKLKKSEQLFNNVVTIKKAQVMSYQNYIYKKVAINISDTYADISIYNRAITRQKLVFSGSSIFDIQYLYPLISELTYPTSVFKTVSQATYS